ncbi:hypothetical protein VKT23_015901 [Stygiomarasmius scandens]|uniref:Uncharacterized protein n=1 Tax=Marasmiellus scandens TaxID=2682957 RepID=A0ABR1IW87_9AGAR
MTDPALLPPLQSDKFDEDDDNGSNDQPYFQGDVKLSKNSCWGVPHEDHNLAAHIDQPELPTLIHQFLHNQHHLDIPDAPQGCNIPQILFSI